MTTTPTPAPASQPSPVISEQKRESAINCGLGFAVEKPSRREHEAHCNLRFPATLSTKDDHCDCAASQARSDMLDAERAPMPNLRDFAGEVYTAMRCFDGTWGRSSNEMRRAELEAKAARLMSAESAPTGETIKSWEERLRLMGFDGDTSIEKPTPTEVCMLTEIRDLRAALARRATAGTPTGETIDLGSTIDAKVWAEEFCRVNVAPDYDTMRAWFANAIMVGFNEGERRATAGNATPDRPDDFGQEVTRLVNEIRKPISMALRDSLVEQLIELIDPTPEGVERAATAAPGDLPEAAYVGALGTKLYTESQVRALLASNAGAAPAIPEGYTAHSPDCKNWGCTGCMSPEELARSLAPSNNSPVGAHERKAP